MADLSCRAVGKNYGARVVLAGVDLVVPEGTVTAILGASGSGKTTLLRLIIGFLRLDQGAIAVGGKVVADASVIHLPPERRAVGYVAQEGALYPHLSVGENVGFGLARHQRKTSTRVGQVLELVGLQADDARRSAHELSGGEQRRVALARALAPQPGLVLLDEPFSGLDAALRVETREAVLGALANERTTAVLVTHDQAEALSMGREVAVLRRGRLVQTASPDVVYGRPTDLDVARFVGEAVVMTGRAHSDTVTCALGRLPVADHGASGEVLVVIRPEQIQVGVGPGADDQSGLVVATVLDRRFFGPDSVVRLALSGSGTVVSAKVFSHLAPQVGEVVRLTVAGPVVAYAAEPADRQPSDR